MKDPNRLSVFFTVEEHAELEKQAKRLDRKKSWIIQRAWKIARDRIQEFPAAPASEE